MRWFVSFGVLVPVVALAAVPATVSADMADMIADAGSVAGLVLSVWLGIWAFRKMRATLAGELSGGGKAYGGRGYLRRKEAEEIRALRKAGWSNAEIRRGSKGLDAWD
ncbi:MAG: hypothetical protein LC136_15465 [Burkholderiales bacterium]|nr:hypothetical protein [Burkholderiales bacterium]